TMFRGQYSFPVAFGQQGRPPTKWQVIPQPKSLVFHALYCRPAPEQGWRRGAPGYFEIERLADREDGVAEKIVGVGERECSEALQPATIFGAYVLDVSPARWLLRGRGNVGLVWAEQTLDHLRMSERLLSGQDRVPCVEVRDAPSLPIRAVSLSLPTTRWGYPNDAPVSPNFFQDFLDRVVVASKLNFVVLIVDQGMQLSTHPEVQGPAAWSQQVVAQIVGHLREQGIEVVPCLNSLGHAVWVTASHPELREDGDPQTLCTSHPNSRKIIGEIYDEVLRVFQPRYFHIGMDEVRWQTLNVPERQRCPLCAGKTKADVFAEQVKWLHGFMAERGVKTMMWGDMLLPAHNGGPPFEVAQAIDRIPKDIVICNWSCAVDPLSLWYFRSRGFSEVIKSNSLGASPADTPFIKGNMYGCWAKLPWLVESPLGYSAYNFLSILQAADYSWNLHPDVFTPSIDLDPAFFVERRLALARLVLSSCRDAAEIHGWATKLAGRKLSDVPAVPAAGQVLSAADIGASSGRWLVLVAAFRCSEKQLAELRERLKDKVNWLGAPAATVKFSYVDGQTAEAALRFGYHFRATGSPGLPFVYGAYALNDAPMWYAIPIENPRPTAALRAVSLVPDTAAADVHLSAVRLFKE
ncbi:MAG: family 20 glycosylhydrolase, partial [Armatimonadetes bacterium]|nr:family 20 glycosylhydrolase [Armatimonadota bacterium]